MPERCAPGARRGCDRLWRWGMRGWSVPEAVIRRGCYDWAELEKTAKKMIESSQELADSVESAEGIDRFQILDIGSEGSLRHLSRHYWQTIDGLRLRVITSICRCPLDPTRGVLDYW